MTPRQQAVLMGILRDRERLAALEPRYVPGDYRVAREREQIADARRGRVQCNPSAWLGAAITPSLSTMVSRTYQQLERRGLVERLALGFDGGRTTHLALTADGARVARELAARASHE